MTDSNFISDSKSPGVSILSSSSVSSSLSFSEDFSSNVLFDFLPEDFFFLVVLRRLFLLNLLLMGRLGVKIRLC